MKVICIDATTRYEHCPFVEGQIYTADPEVQCHEGCGFKIVEEGSLWNKDRFAPVSDIDETELLTEEFKEKYLVPA